MLASWAAQWPRKAQSLGGPGSVGQRPGLCSALVVREGGAGGLHSLRPEVNLSVRCWAKWACPPSRPCEIPVPLSQQHPCSDDHPAHPVSASGDRAGFGLRRQAQPAAHKRRASDPARNPGWFSPSPPPQVPSSRAQEVPSRPGKPSGCPCTWVGWTVPRARLRHRGPDGPTPALSASMRPIRTSPAPAEREAGSSSNPSALAAGAPARVLPESLKVKRGHSQQRLGQV